VLISDLRMGQEPSYTFTFHVADKHSAAVPLASPQQLGGRGDVGCLLRWLRQRTADQTVPSPVRFCRAAAPSLEPVR
jgi:inner membrane protein